jgi:hypothetical protein
MNKCRWICIVLYVVGSILILSETTGAIEKMVLIDCTGKLSVRKQNGRIAHEKKLDYTEIGIGYLFEDVYFTSDYHHLILINIYSGERKEIDLYAWFENNSTKQVSYDDFELQKITYVNKEWIYFKIQSMNQQNDIGDGNYNFKYNRLSHKILRVMLPKRYKISSINNDSVCYTNSKDYIFLSQGEKRQKLKIRGGLPTISPNSRFIAFTTDTFLSSRSCLQVYDLLANQIIFKERTWLGAIIEKIKWSNDSRYLCINTYSDLFSAPFYVFDVLNERTVYKNTDGICEGWVINSDIHIPQN